MMRRYHQPMPHRRGDDLHEQGDIRDGERRWCEVFARLWEVLMLQPLGAYLQVPRRQGRDLRVEHTGLQILQCVMPMNARCEPNGALAGNPLRMGKMRPTEPSFAETIHGTMHASA